MTSILCTAVPKPLRPDRIRDQASDEPIRTSTSPHLRTGVVGSAAHASPALGEPLWHACVKAVADIMRLIDIDPGSMHGQATIPFES